jgi:CubicO group peptidase (beta-lactamase class C family)
MFSRWLTVLTACAPVLSAQETAFEKLLCPRFFVEGASPQKWSIAERMAHYKVPGVSVAIVRNGEIVFAQGYGVREAGKPDPVNPETVFQAASISKPVAAAAALHMVQYGKLSLDEDVDAKLKGWKVPHSSFAASQKVTLRQLLSHTSGLGVRGFPGYRTTAPVPTVVQVLNGEKPANTPAVKLELEPGSQWRYSGGGYTVMQLLLTEQSGMSFPELTERMVLKPAGMKRSTYQQPLPEAWAANAARAHTAEGKPVEGGWHVYPEMAAAGLWTTPSDLARFAIDIWRSARPQSAGPPGNILSREMARRMLTLEKGNFGLGLSLEGTGASSSFGHGGSNQGFKCQMVLFRESGNGAVIMTNGELGGALHGEILRAIAIAENWPDFQPQPFKPATVSESQLKRYQGEYVLERLTVRITAAKTTLLASLPGGRQAELVPESETRFRTLDGSLPVVVFTSSPGQMEIQVGDLKGIRTK